MIAVAVVVTVLGALVGLAWLGQRWIIYLPDRGDPGPAAAALPGAQDVTLTTSDGLELGAWHLPATPGCPTVLVAQGNGGNRGGRAMLGSAIGDLGFGVLLMDYRGYGGNPGSPSQEGLARDVRAAREHLLDRGGVAPGLLVYLGESLGAAVAAELAAEHPPAALVLRSPFTSLADAGRAVYGVPVGWILRDGYPVTEHVAGLDLPVAVVHGTADAIVPPGMSRQVAQAARGGGSDVVEVEVTGADHNDVALAAGPDLMGALVTVADRAGAGCSGRE